MNICAKIHVPNYVPRPQRTFCLNSPKTALRRAGANIVCVLGLEYMSYSETFCHIAVKKLINNILRYAVVTGPKISVIIARIWENGEQSVFGRVYFLNGHYMSMGLRQAIFCVQMTSDLSNLMRNRILSNFSSECSAQKMCYFAGKFKKLLRATV